MPGAIRGDGFFHDWQAATVLGKMPPVICFPLWDARCDDAVGRVKGLKYIGGFIP